MLLIFYDYVPYKHCCLLRSGNKADGEETALGQPPEDFFFSPLPFVTSLGIGSRTIPQVNLACQSNVLETLEMFYILLWFQ